MIKKVVNIFLFSLAIFLLSSCEKSTVFNFNDLKVDLSDASALGIAPKINKDQNLSRLSSEKILLNNEDSTELTETELVMIDDEGNLKTVEFINDSGDIVQVPYNLYTFEVVGQFTYLIYYNPESVGDFNNLVSFSVFFNHFSTEINLLFDYFNGVKTTDVRKIVIHNESGSIFDYTSIVDDIYDSYQDLNQKPDVGGFFSSINGFFFRIRENSQLDNPKTCTNFASYNSTKDELDINSQCSTIDYNPLMGLSEDIFIYETYNSNAAVSYFTYNQGEFNLIEKPINLNPAISRIFNLNDSEIGVLTIDGFLSTYNNQLDLIDTVNMQDLFGEAYGGNFRVIQVTSEELYIKTGSGYFFVFDLIDKKIKQQINLNVIGNFRVIRQNDSFILFAENGVYILNTTTFELSTVIDSIEYDAFKAIRHYVLTGYIKIEYIQGLNTITKFIDPITLETIETINDNTTKSFWSVKPIN